MKTITNKITLLILVVFVFIPYGTHAVNKITSLGSPYPQFPFQKNLSYNLCDNDVQTLQNYLINHKYLPTGTIVTGKFDTSTVKAVKKLQLSVGLKSDGIVGPKTRAFLNKENGKQKYDVLKSGYGTGLIPTAKCIYEKIPVAQIPGN
jgi:peptidoglycan hydrolase-like protein with peptidoglycan-binding domain